MAYWRLHYHLVWTTERRLPCIDGARSAVIHRVIRGKAKELETFIHAVGDVSDHLHVVASAPPKLAIADCVGQLKGATSHAVNLEIKSDPRFCWQAGYGALTVSSRSLAAVIAYVLDQPAHHHAGSTIAAFERCEERGDGVHVVLDSAEPD